MYFDPWFLQSTAGASLLANASPLTLMTSPLSVTNQNVTPFGMLGGLVPVTMPFQFPLELLGFGTDTAGVTTTSGSTSAAFHHSLTQSKWGSWSYWASQCVRAGNLMTIPIENSPCGVSEDDRIFFFLRNAIYFIYM